MKFTDYQILILIILFVMNVLCAGLVVFTCYSLIRFKGFRDSISQAIQDGDGIFHWIDAKSVGYFVAGLLSAWWTMNISGAVAYAKMFDIGAVGFIGLFVGITFTLLGIAYKK